MTNVIKENLNKGLSAQYWAALLGEQVTVNDRDPDGRTPLLLACQADDEVAVEAMLSAGASPQENATDDLLFWPGANANARIMQALLNAGVPADSVEALKICVSTQVEEVLEVMLAAGAAAERAPWEAALAESIKPLNIPLTGRLMALDHTPPGPEFFAGEHEDMIWQLGDTWIQPKVLEKLDRLVEVGMPTTSLTGYVKYWYENPQRWTRKDAFPSSKDRRELLEHMLNRYGARPCEGLLHAACAAGAPASDLTLLAAADPGQVNLAGPDGATPLLALLACNHGKPIGKAQLRALLDLGADPNLPGPEGTTALSLATQNGDAYVSLLEEYGAKAAPPPAAAPPAP